MLSTLVLNANYTPLSVIPISSISWKEAIKVSFLGHARAVEYYPDWQVHSPSVCLDVPSVMISETYIKKRHGVKFSRFNLLLRDKFICQYCNKKLDLMDLTIDHVLPRSRGGLTSWNNCVCACYVCNSIKGHRMNMKPKQPPIKPEYYQLINNAKAMPLKIPSETWIKYLGWDETLITIVKPNQI